MPLRIGCKACTSRVATIADQRSVEEPAQIMWPYYTNNTCDPASGQQDSVCTIGYYPEYVITAKSKEHIIAGVNFARENNIRLVIRNTGHDFMGRSTGRGALSINTHSFQGMDFVDKYTGPGGWKGGAVTLGAGVMHRDLYPVAFKKNVVVVGGECLTVGISGGRYSARSKITADVGQGTYKEEATGRLWASTAWQWTTC